MREALDLIRVKVSAGEADIAWAEETLKSAALAHAAVLLGMLYSQELPELLGMAPPPGARGTRERTVLTTLGEVTYTRARVPGGSAGSDRRSSYPLDTAIGITNGCTPAMASMATWAGANFDSYDKTCEALKRLAGVGMCGRRAQRLVNSTAEAEAAWVAARAADAGKRAGGILNIQADMTGIPMRPSELAGTKGRDGAPPKKKQIKVGAVFKQEANAQGEIQRVPGSTTRIISFDEVADFSRALMNEAVKRGYHEADTVVFTSDGAEWIWLMAADRFKGAVEIVDFYHAAQHLAALCALAAPDGDAAAGAALFKDKRRVLKNWGVEPVIRFFEDAARAHPDKEDAIKDKLGYFTRNRRRMRYREFRAKGYFIGSGVIEGTCKNLVNQRTDLAGQRWLKTGSLNVLRIRAATMDGLHDEYWSSIGNLSQKTA